MRNILVIIVLLPLVTGCLAKRDFRSRTERPRKNTAYTLAHKEFNVGIGLMGQSTYNLLLNAEFAAGIGNKWEVGANLGHAALGIMSVYGKYNFIDKKWWALAARVGVTWIHVKAVWALPDQYREPLGKINILSIPIEIHSSFPVADWVGLHLSVGYIPSQIFGKINEDTLFINSDAGANLVYLRPNITFYIAERVEVYLAARLLLWGGRYGEVAAEATNNEDLILGARSTSFTQFEFRDKSFFVFGANAKFGKVTYLGLWAMVQGARANAALVAMPVIPGLDLFWRF
jgi:hypothetical protein